MFRHWLSVMILTVLGAHAVADTHLTLVGGGVRPKAALKAFVSHVTPSRSIWVLPWGTAFPKESFETIKAELLDLGPFDVRCACDLTIDLATLKEIEEAGGYYFPGGNQNLIIDRLVQTDLLSLIRNKFASGTPVAGTSAGTAIQSDPMLTGDGSNLGAGLGLLSGFLVDQHFWVRKREERLLAALNELRVLNHEVKVGLGIDENMAVQITNGTHFQALGPSRISFYQWNSTSAKFDQKDLFDHDEIDVITSF